MAERQRLDLVSNEDIEMRWVAAWNDVFDIIGPGRVCPCLLPDYSVVSVDECLGWLQDSVYKGYLVTVEAGWVGHLRGVVAHRRSPEAGDENE